MEIHDIPEFWHYEMRRPATPAEIRRWRRTLKANEGIPDIYHGVHHFPRFLCCHKCKQTLTGGRDRTRYAKDEYGVLYCEKCATQ